MDDRGPTPAVEGIAVIGLAGRFPGAPNVEAFWENLKAGVESISFFSDSELEASRIEESPALRDPSYVKARGILEAAADFDSSFFGFTPREAAVTDPQHRLFLECAWEALESAGYDPRARGGPVGVFAGTSLNTYLLNNVLGRRDLIEQTGPYPIIIGNDKDYLATRVSYKLDLRGPSLTIQTSCSTSLVAVVLACQSLWSFQCDMALAGGASITFPQKKGYVYQEGGIGSPDGRCRAFDANAQGTADGEGVGIVVLKRLSDAVADGDSISAVILGAAINNDGSEKVGFTAPSVEGQAEVIAAAQALAGVPAETITYVEAHGTGTPLGDPIEIAALTRAFRQSTAKRGFCAIGTVKTNIGHLDAAAGVAGLIKTVLALERGVIPPSLHFERPNPRIDFAESPFFVNARLSEWKRGGTPRRAGVSSFGIGGTNAHVVLEEPPEREPSEKGRDFHLLPLSANSGSALDRGAANLAERLAREPTLSIADIAYTLQVGRRPFAHRRFLVCRDTREASEALRGLDSRRVPAGVRPDGEPGVVFLFPGQGAQAVGMGSELYQREALFREEVDRCCELLKPKLGMDLREVLYTAPGRRPESAETLRQTLFAQPALFTTEYALARLWMAWGVRPRAMMGHSVGEYVAACLSGVFSLEDALALVALRAQLVQERPRGAMLAVRLPEAEARTLLADGLCLAAVNGPSLCVLSGSLEAVAKLEEALRGRGVASRLLATSHAFHSEMMDPVLDRFSEAVGSVRRNAPEIPYVSNVTADWITGEQVADPRYWARHLREPVRFSDGISRLRGERGAVFLEVGPGQTLTTLARQHKPTGPLTLSTFDPREGSTEVASLLDTLGRLWLAGVDVDWKSFHAGERRFRVRLPTYSFERERCWVEPAREASGPGAEIARETGHVFEPGSSEEAARVIEGEGARAPSDDGGPASRGDRIASALTDLFAEISGMDLAQAEPGASFLELGFDSLFLTQASAAIARRFGVKVSFRQLIDELPTLETVTAHLEEVLPAESFAAAAVPESVPRPLERAVSASSHAASPLARIEQQLTAVARQIEILRAGGSVPAAVEGRGSGALPESPKRFGPYKPIDKGAGREITPRQQEHLARLIARYASRTGESKRRTQAYRRPLADPRAVAGFRTLWKEMVYPIVVERAKGSRMWDVDGNEYVDLTMGFGVNLFGHSPDFAVAAIQEQLGKGIEIGPQALLAGEVAERICALTGMERATFCNTGSEAVLAATRLARTVTGRPLIAIFSDSYHGLFDEVLVRPTRIGGRLRSVPIAPGIPAHAGDDILVLEYGNPESLEVLRQHAEDLAAVMVEPVQSRRPDVQPKEFLQELRKWTESAGVALIFDETITGFRVHPGGAQAYFGVRADIATYGKVIGGGMPIGVVTGSSLYMDALDGGTWSYGDASAPPSGVTFFAGTFVRHPLALAAARAVLDHLEASGPELQLDLNRRTAAFVQRLNALLTSEGVPVRIPYFSSFFNLPFDSEPRFGSLFFYHLREKGVHVWEGRPGFLSTAHTDEDLERIISAVSETIRELREADLLAEGEPPPRSDARGGVPGPQEATRLPLTDEQQELWVAAQLGDAASRVYNESLNIHLRGELDSDALRRALDGVVERHEALRTTFDPRGDFQTIAPAQALELPVADLSTLRPEERESALARVFSSEADPAFDLARGPLLRARLVKVAAREHVLVLTVHHIVCDGWSAAVVLGELAELYSAETRGIPARLPPAVPFREFAASRSRAEEEGERRETEAYWIEEFRRPVSPLELPLDHPRPAVKTYKGARLTVSLEPSLLEGSKRLGARHGCTLFTTLLAAFQLLLHRLTGQEEVVVGVPAAGQALAEGGALVGHCVNFLPLRVRVAGNPTVAEYLAAVKRTVLAAYDHQGYTFGRLIQRLSPVRDASRSPLVDVTFNLDRDLEQPEFHGLNVTIDKNPPSAVDFDLNFNLIETERALLVECDYSTELFEEETVRRWIGHFQTLLQTMVADPGRRIDEVPLLTEEERRRIVVEWNRTEREEKRPACVHELFEAQVERAPEAVAVAFERGRLTYRELNDRANQVAHHLRSRGVGPEVPVGIFLDRSLEMAVALLAVLKAGGAYVPLDPAYPKERIAFLLEDSEVPLVLTHQRFVKNLPRNAARILALDREAGAIAGESSENPDRRATVANLAYVIYTSGSTGKPKGVLIPHGALANHCQAFRRFCGLTPRDRVLQFASLSFDVAAEELFPSWAAGAAVVLRPDSGAADLPGFLAFLRREGLTVMNLPAALWQEWVSELSESPRELPASLRLVVAGSERVAPEKLALWQKQVGAHPKWLNAYGPTETTITATIYDPSGSEQGRAVHSVPIGRPLANTQAYLLDPYGEPVPVGVAGELHIGGAGLARGYRNRPDLTEEGFVPNPFSGDPGGRMYRTGDLARYLPDGNIEFLGRRDDQVKIRGFRVEPAEIEAALAEHPMVREAAVAAREEEPGDRRLVGYVVASGKSAPGTPELRRFLKERLPDYMIPSLFLPLAELPRTAGGKLDRRALPAPDRLRPELEEAFAAPRTPLEETLAAIWTEVLRLERVGIHDDFFELGGHSLLATQVISRVRECFSVELPLHLLFQGPTVAELAIAIAQSQAQNSEPEEVARLLAELESEADDSPSQVT